jgi:hypothetical protein
MIVEESKSTLESSHLMLFSSQPPPVPSRARCGTRHGEIGTETHPTNGGNPSNHSLLALPKVIKRKEDGLETHSMKYTYSLLYYTYYVHTTKSATRTHARTPH